MRPQESHGRNTGHRPGREYEAGYTASQERSNGGERLLAVVSGAVRRTLAFPPVQRHELRGIGGEVPVEDLS